MKFIYGGMGVLVLSLVAALWALKSAWGEVRVQETHVIAATARSDALAAKFDSIDRAVSELAAETSRNQQALTQALVDLQNVQPMEEDSDETIVCLDLLVPGAVDGLLRGVARGNGAKPDTGRTAP